MKQPETLIVKLDVDYSDFEKKRRNVDKKYQDLIIAIEELRDAEIKINDKGIKKKD